MTAWYHYEFIEFGEKEFNPEYGQKLYDCRSAIAKMIDGVQCGYAQYILPEPCAKQDDVVLKIRQIDTEWNRELSRAYSRKFAELNLSEDLSDNQKLALIDEIHGVKQCS